ncbi:MAG: hypothetical protein ACKVRO_13285 [Micropepsaceae bacterium]
MNKLPVFRVAGRAIGFTLWNSFTIFRLAWLPVAALFAAQIGLSAYIMQIDGETMRGLPNPLSVAFIMERLVAFNVTNMILQAIALAAVAVSIHRVILFGDRKPGQYFNFAFGKTEFLYIVMGVLTALIVLGVLAAVITPFVLVLSGGDPVGMFKKFADDPDSAAQAIGGAMSAGGVTAFLVVYFVAYILIIYFSLRLAVWPPAVVATNRISPREPWQLTRGNVWRLIGAFILTFGWIYVLVLVPAAGAYWYYTNKMKEMPTEVPAITAPASPEAEAPTTPPTAPERAGAAPAPSVAPAPPAIPAQPQQPTPPAAPVTPSPATPPPEAAMPEIAPDGGDVRETLDRDAPRRQLEAMVGPFAAAMWVAFLFMYIFFTSLAVALMSFSYKALKGYEPHEPIPEDG